MDISIPVSAVYIGLQALLALYLATQVQRLRVKGDDAPQDQIAHQQRVQLNNIEYGPYGLLLLVGMELMGAPFLVLHLYGGIFTIARIAHGISFGRNPGFSRGRFMGTLVTYVLLALGSVYLIYLGLMAGTGS